jgi:hypothetical protein
MKARSKALSIVVGLFVLIASLSSAAPMAAQTQGTDNLLFNPGFEAGYHHQDGVPELAVPDGWRLHYLDNVNFLGSDAPAARPETVVWNIADAPVNEQSLFFRDGSYALKVFKGGRPIYAALSQDVSGLEVGRRYRLVAPIFIDIVASYGSGGKVAPIDMESGLVRLGASPVGAAWLDESAIAYSGWWTAATISPFYLDYPIFVFDFTATQDNMTVWVEFGSRDSYPNNGFFLDTLGLYTLDEYDNSVSNNPAPANPAPASAPSGPTPTPFPTPTPRPDGAIIHVVQVGDSFWSLAIRYAPALGLTPEEALPVIRELNNNPTFLNLGQEVVIVAANETAVEASEPGPESEALAAAVEESPTEEPATPEPTPTAEAQAVALAPVVSEPEAGSDSGASNAICVSAFNDENGDGLPGAQEELLADAAFTVSNTTGTVATYISDGINEPHCFEGLEADTYRISFSQPPDYRLTTDGNWAIPVSDGKTIPIQFGAQIDETTLAAAQPKLPSDSPAGDSAGSGDEAPDAALGSQLGSIALGIAIVLVFLVGVGFLLLRRS